MGTHSLKRVYPFLVKFMPKGVYERKKRENSEPVMLREKSAVWKGIDASYAAKHLWIVKHYGKASECSKCNGEKAKRFEWANVSGKYLREVEDYIQLCPSCHRRMDKGDFCKRGHRFDDKNTYIIKSRNARACRKCYSIANKKYANRNKTP